MPRACVLQHIRCEPPGLFSGLLRDRGFVIEVVEVTDTMLAEWQQVPAYQKSAEAVLGADGFQYLAAAFAAARDSMARSASGMFNAWLDLVARR
jgi:hypothetical protein